MQRYRTEKEARHVAKNTSKDGTPRYVIKGQFQDWKASAYKSLEEGERIVATYRNGFEETEKGG